MKCKNCKTKIKSNQKFCPECGAEIKPKKTLSKKAQAFIACACCLVLVISGTIGGLYFYQSNNAIDDSDSNYIALGAGFTDVKVTDEKSALEAINSVADVIGIENVEEELKISSTNTLDNDTYYRFQQYYNDIPVFGKDISIVANKEGTVNALTTNFEKINNNTKAKITIEEARQIVLNDINKEFSIYNENETLSYYIKNNKIYLCYIINVSNGNRYFIDSRNGETVDIFYELKNEKAACNIDGKTFDGIKLNNGNYILGDYNKNIFAFNSDYNASLYDDENGNICSNVDIAKPMISEDTIFGNNDDYSVEEYRKGQTIITYLSQISDYYKSINANQNVSAVIILNDSYDADNAFGGYGDLSTISTYNIDYNEKITHIILGVDLCNNIEWHIETLGHEFTHGITDSQLDWGYQKNGNSGAICEAYSDIFGEIIEAKINKTTPDWLHGDRNIIEPQKSFYDTCYYEIRGMECPLAKKGNHVKNENHTYKNSLFEKTCITKSNYPESINSEYYDEDLDCHINSTIISHAAYLMWNGIDGNESKKIDTDTLAKIWYRSLLLMQTNPSFKQCANAVVISAEQLYKSGLIANYNQVECVKEAFAQVGITPAYGNQEIVSGAKLYVKDFLMNNYNNYNLKVYKIKNQVEAWFPENIRNDECIVDIDVTDTNGYEFNLETGLYYIVVSDNDEKGSSTNFKKCITVVKRKNPSEFYKQCYIDTDFGKITTVVLNNEVKDDNLSTLPGEYVFSSGVGAWSTELNINEDFTFSGMYHDSELGLTGEKNPNGTVIICEFTGKFSNPEKIDEYTYKLPIESLSLKQEDGYVYYNNGIEYECIGEPYGFDDCREFYFYIRERQTNDLSEDFLGWIYEYDENSGVLPCNCIRNPQTDVCFVKYESTEANNTEDMKDESTTVKESITNNVGKFYGNETPEQLRKSIIGSWGALGSIVPEYNFIDSENCSGENPWQSSGTYSISDNKMLTISWGGKSKLEEYVWSTESWDEFYSHHKYGTNFWCMTDDGILKLNGKEKYRDGTDNSNYNSDGDLMTIITGTWISDKGSTEYKINSDGTWIESTVVVSGGTLINRTTLDNGKVEIIDDTTAKLWQETKSLSQIPGASELIYDSKNDKISVGGTNNSFTRAKYD